MYNRRATEWPTIALIALVYVVIATLVWFHASLPWWILLPVGSYFAALHSSLQHEVLHGHPTGNRLINEALIFVTPHFWLPFPRYRDTHLTHHNDRHLTDPRRDPESMYMLPEDWNALPGIKRRLYRMNNTLVGRMVMGPAITVIRFWSGEFVEIAKGDAYTARAWAYHAAACAVMIYYIVAIAGMPLWQYVLLFAYPGVSLALVRSFCEHQAAEDPDHRTIIVEASPFWSLLFLNNNLHVAHHTRPTLAWYRLPAYYRAEKPGLLAKNDGYFMKGYGEIFRRYGLVAKEPVPHPHMEWLEDAQGPAA
ncbi:MAG: fatty acid desaturase [Alphaproteobacteria bacterium]|nr:fatty acid desaturase [Alphaproteobacteria bacterium]